jgi:hypothetical protein
MAERWRWLVAALLLMVLAACSSTRLAYNHADWLIQRQVAKQFDLAPAQREWLRGEIDAHLAWHCRTQLPGYAEWLATHRALLLQPAVTPSDLAAALGEAQPFFTRAAERIVPTAVELLRDLSPAQIDHFRQHFDRRQRELAKKYVEPPLAEVVAQRSRNLERRLSHWTGRLTPAQRERIGAWSAGQGDFNTEWLASRQRWHDALLAALSDRHAPGFEPTVQQLLTAPETFHDAAWRERTTASWEAGLALSADLLNSATPRQRQRLDERLDQLAADLTALRCDQPDETPVH